MFGSSAAVGGLPGDILVLVALALAGAMVHALRPRGWSARVAMVAVAVALAGGAVATGARLSQTYRVAVAAPASAQRALLHSGVDASMRPVGTALGAVPLWLVLFLVGEVRRRWTTLHQLQPAGAGMPLGRQLDAGWSEVATPIPLTDIRRNGSCRVLSLDAERTRSRKGRGRARTTPRA